MSVRAEILSLFVGEKLASPPTFSGLIHALDEGLASEGLVLREAHRDARKMARAATNAFMLTGMPSATLPLDLCLPAEALGAELNYATEGFPQVKQPLVESVADIARLTSGNSERVELACEAIRFAREIVGDDAVISGMIAGPYTLLLYLCDLKSLFIEMKKEPQAVSDALLWLSSFLARIGGAYRNAGADFVTVHEAGGSPGFIGPARFERFVLPALKALHADLPNPRVLSVCGDTNRSMSALAESGAEAISVDELNDLAESRKTLKDALLFGNLDAAAMLWKGAPAEIVEAARRAKESGVDALWPGCDLVAATPLRNIKAMLSGGES